MVISFRLLLTAATTSTSTRNSKLHEEACWLGVLCAVESLCLKRLPGTIYDGVYHTPLGRFRSSIAPQLLGASANTERYVFGKLSAMCFQRRPFWHRHCSKCGCVERGKSARGVAICTIVCRTSGGLLYGLLYQLKGFRIAPSFWGGQTT